MDQIWKAAAGVLSTVAPMLATAVGGPLAGAATAAIAKALGLPQEMPAEEVAFAVQNATPDQLLAIKKAEQDFAVKMKALDIDIIALGNADRDSARRREMAVKDWMPRVLGILMVSASVGAVALVLLGYAKVDDALAGSLVGLIVGSGNQVVQYYFGSSAGSAAKDVVLRGGK